MKSKLARFTSRNVPLARPSACTKCGSTQHTSLGCTRDRKPLARTARMNPRREEPRRVDRATGRTDEVTPAEREYMDRVRELPCCALGMPGHVECSGPPVAHHAGKHGMGFKSDHYETIPLCDTAHKQLHDTPGNGWTVASGLDGEGIRAFEDRHIAATQRRLNYTAPAR